MGRLCAIARQYYQVQKVQKKKKNTRQQQKRFKGRQSKRQPSCVMIDDLHDRSSTLCAPPECGRRNQIIYQLENWQTLRSVWQCTYAIDF